MNLPFSFKQKIKLAFMLFGIMISIIMVRILEDKSLAHMGRAFNSIYNDRLVPATDLFQISAHLHAKQAILESFMDRTVVQNQASAFSQLNIHSIQIDSLLKKYGQTELVTAEQNHLLDLKNELHKHQAMERSVILNLGKGTSIAHDTKVVANQSFTKILEKLAQLTQIQLKVGEELIKDSKVLINGTKLYSSLQFALAIFIGLLIISIVLTTKLLNIKAEKFNLN